MTSSSQEAQRAAQRAALPPGLRASEALLGEAELPVIDFGRWRTGAVDERAAVATELRAACERFGFFYLANHGIPDETIEAARRAQRDFFGLPLEAKREVGWRSYVGEVEPPSSRGYFEVGGEALDPSARPDLKEFLDLSHDCEATRPFTGRNRWPKATPPHVQRDTAAYMDCARQTALELIRALAQSLGLAERHFDEHFSEPTVIHRLIRYPALAPHEVDERQSSCGQHTDYGMLTLLYQDAYGLQMREELSGQWLWVPPPPAKHALTVNLGDCMRIFTNGRYESTLHRVVNCAGDDRYTMAYFMDPNFTATVKPVDGLVSADAGHRFEPLQAGQMKLAKYEATWGEDLKIEHSMDRTQQMRLFEQFSKAEVPKSSL